MIAKDQLKIAIAGCGHIGLGYHIPSLLKIRDVKLVAICDENEELAKRVAQKFKISRYYTDCTKMFSNEEVNMVDICTPPQTHFALCIQAIEAGCHVLVEKPIVSNLAEFDEIAKRAKTNNVRICTVHNKLFEPIMIKARTMVKRGAIGDLTGIDIQILSSKRTDLMLMNKEHWCHSLPAGIFSETLPHPLYLAAAFMGKLAPLGAFTGKSCNHDWVAANEIRIVFKAERGLGTISFICNSPKSKTIIDIHGTKKHLRIDLFNSVITEYGVGIETIPSRALENLGQSYSILTNSISTMLSVISGRFRQGHDTVIKQFIESIQYDTEPPVTLQEARDVIEVLEKITAQI
jgi:predicted dehydrogenase